MNSELKPSRRVSHNVYLEDDGCILEYKINGKTIIYEILENGESSLISNSNIPYQPSLGQVADDYYLDHLGSACLSKIDVLTTKYDYNEIITGFQNLIHRVDLAELDPVDFTMEDAYIIEDYKDAIKQLYEFTQEEEYQTRLNSVSKFFDEYFYNQVKLLTANDLQTIKKTLVSELNFLETLNIS